MAAIDGRPISSKFLSCVVWRKTLGASEASCSLALPPKFQGSLGSSLGLRLFSRITSWSYLFIKSRMRVDVLSHFGCSFIQAAGSSSSSSFSFICLGESQGCITWLGTERGAAAPLARSSQTRSSSSMLHTDVCLADGCLSFFLLRHSLRHVFSSSGCILHQCSDPRSSGRQSTDTQRRLEGNQCSFLFIIFTKKKKKQKRKG